MTPQRQKRLREQIRRSRARLMVSDPVLAMVLMYLRFVATKDVYRISTNGREILFDPDRSNAWEKGNRLYSQPRSDTYRP